MAQQLLRPEVVVYLCSNCVPSGSRLPRQWVQKGAHVLVREVPCSGKVDGQYLLHALEGGEHGVCVVACPKGECHLAQGNYRAEIRLRTVQRLLSEIGLEPQRAQLVHCSADDSPEHVERVVRDAVDRICVYGASPLQAAKACCGQWTIPIDASDASSTLSMLPAGTS